MTEHNMDHLEHLEGVALADVAELRRKEATYQGSWKRRGGVGTFMMLARKWDRLEQIAAANPERRYDIFWQIEKMPSGRDGTALAEVRDLRRYLLLVEAEMVSRGVVQAATTGLPEVSLQWIKKAISPDLRARLKEIERAIQDLPPGSPSRRFYAEQRIIQEELTNRGHEEFRPGGETTVDFGGGVHETGRVSLEENRPGTPEDGGHHAAEEPDLGPAGIMTDREWNEQHPVTPARRVPCYATHLPYEFHGTLDKLQAAVGEDLSLYTALSKELYRLDDWRLAPRSGDPPAPYIFLMDGTDVISYWVLDRRVLPEADLPELPTLARELNNYEWKIGPGWARGMYAWSGADHKWHLKQEYDRWAAQP